MVRRDESDRTPVVAIDAPRAPGLGDLFLPRGLEQGPPTSYPTLVAPVPVANASGDVDLDLHDDDGPTRPLRDRTTRLTTPNTMGVRVLWAAAYWLSIALLVLVTLLVSLDVQR